MKRLVLICLFTLALSDLAYAQENIMIEEHQEKMDTTEFSSLLERYNHIIRADEEKLSVFTVDLLEPFLYLISNWGDTKTEVSSVVDVAYEQKFKPNWSWIVGSVYSADRSSYRELELNGGARYYYNMNRRILKGKSANNFSANYLSSTVHYGRRFNDDDSQVTWNLGYGFQRRLGKRTFVDLTVGLENIFEAYSNRETGIDLFINSRFGLAF